MNLFLDEVKKSDIQQFRDVLLKRGMDPNTVNLRLECLVTAFNEAIELDLIEKNPARGVRARDNKRKGKKSARRPFKKSEVIKLIDVSSPCLIGAEVTAMNIGARNGDITNIKLSDVGLKTLRVEYFNRKGKRDMETPLLPEFVRFTEELLKHHPSPNQPDTYLLWRYGGKNTRVQILDIEFAAALKSCGLRDPGAVPRSGSGRRSYPLVFHCFRWVLNMACKLSKMADVVTIELLGHKDLQTSAIYQDVGIPEKRAALYKAAGKDKLLRQFGDKEEPYMTIKDIIEVTKYATKRLRQIRLGVQGAGQP